MALLNAFAAFSSLFVIALGCELTSTQAEIDAKAALEDYVTQKKSELAKEKYRLHYHVTPPVGWMNDPNGFSYYKDNHHLFYQYNPYETQAGNINWGHVVSQDLVSWTHMPVALLKEEEQCFSGSAIEKEGLLILLYTAHKTLEGQTPDVNETQYIASSSDGVVFNKYVNNPVIASTPNNAVDFRDPKVWKYGDYYYVIIGSKTENDRGRVLLYRSTDMGNWDFFSFLAESDGTLGYMWECPDFFELDGKYIILMSPQGINPDGDRYQNQHQTGYIIGSFDYGTGKFVQEVPFQEIDYGTDFYATQTMEKNGKRYLIAWMGMWDASHPEAEEGWAGAMTMVRELTLYNGTRILMKPIDAMDSLRDDPVTHDGYLSTDTSISLTKTGELLVTGDWAQDISLEFKGNNDEGAVITVGWDATTHKVVVTRGETVRQAEWTVVSSQAWRIFLDASSIEVFCGEGEMVFSSRAYPNGSWTVTNRSAQNVDIVAYTLKRSIPQ